MARLTPEKWAEVKAVWAVGKRTNREIGERFGISHVAIQKRATAENWQRLDENIVNESINAHAKVTNEVTKVTENSNLVTLHVKTELELQGEIRAKTQRNSALLADAIPAMLAQCETPQHLQTLANANKLIAETGKDMPTTAIQINNNPSKWEIV